MWGYLDGFFIFACGGSMAQAVRHRGLESHDLNLIKLSEKGGRQGKEDHGDNKGRDRKRGKERTLEMTGDGCSLSDSSGQK